MGSSVRISGGGGGGGGGGGEGARGTANSKSCVQI